MPIINPVLPNDGEDADASDISAPITAILSVVNGNLDDDNIGSISGTKIADNTIPSVKIANGAITTPKIANGSVNASKLGLSLTTNTIKWDGTTTSPQAINPSVYGTVAGFTNLTINHPTGGSFLVIGQYAMQNGSTLVNDMIIKITVDGNSRILPVTADDIVTSSGKFDAPVCAYHGVFGGITAGDHTFLIQAFCSTGTTADFRIDRSAFSVIAITN